MANPGSIMRQGGLETEDEVMDGVNLVSQQPQAMFVFVLRVHHSLALTSARPMCRVSMPARRT